MRVTDKEHVDELEFIAVVGGGDSMVVHAMRTADHNGWVVGEGGKTVCGRTLPEMWAVGHVEKGYRPCKMCDRTLAVVPIMFETVELVGDVIMMAQAAQWQMLYTQWIDFGIRQGFLSHSFCYSHGTIPMTDKEIEREEEGWDDCFFVARIDLPYNSELRHEHNHDHE